MLRYLWKRFATTWLSAFGTGTYGVHKRTHEVMDPHGQFLEMKLLWSRIDTDDDGHQWRVEKRRHEATGRAYYGRFPMPRTLIGGGC